MFNPDCSLCHNRNQEIDATTTSTSVQPHKPPKTTINIRLTVKLIKVEPLTIVTGLLQHPVRDLF